MPLYNALASTEVAFDFVGRFTNTAYARNSLYWDSKTTDTMSAATGSNKDSNHAVGLSKVKVAVI